MSETGKKWVELARERDNLSGTRILNLIKHLDGSQYTLNKNYNELIVLIKLMNQTN